MPEFKSRMDAYHWQTPVFTDVFSDEAALAPETDKLRLQTRLIEQFTSQNLSITVDRSKTMPSYTFYELSLNEPVEADTLREHIYNIEIDQGWTIGYAQLDDTHLQMLLRAGTHDPLMLSQVVSRGTFRKATNLSSLVIGVNLQQQILVSHWDAIQHMLIVGDRATKESFIHSMLVTQLMLNTPSELRIAFLGENLDAYRYLREAPHSLGDSSKRKSEQGMHLIVGLNRELERRRLAFEDTKTSTLDECNQLRLAMQMPTFPRIIVVLDALNHAEWAKYHERWLVPLCNIIDTAARFGIHILMNEWTLQLPAPFDEVRDRVGVRLLTRSFVENMDIAKHVQIYHPSLLRFVDAFFVRGEQWTPLEIAGVTDDELRSLVVHWRQNAHHRVENSYISNLQSSSGSTARLNDFPERSAPSTALKPTKGALVRATEQLAKVLESDEMEIVMSADQDEKTMTDAHKLIESPGTNSGEGAEDGDGFSIQLESIKKAQALATYLGWLGRGPLMDILGLSPQEADTVIAILQARQILERSTSPTPHLHFRRKR